MGKKVKDDFSDLGFEPVTPTGPAHQPKAGDDFSDLGFEAAEPGAPVKKKGGTSVSSPTLQGISPAADYRKTLTDLSTQIDEFEKMHMDADAIRDVIVKNKDPRIDAINEMVGGIDKKGKQITDMKSVLDKAGSALNNAKKEDVDAHNNLVNEYNAKLNSYNFDVDNLKKEQGLLKGSWQSKLTDEYNALINDVNKKAEQIKILQELAKRQHGAYQLDNRARQKELFKMLDMDEKEQGQVRTELFKAQHPDVAERVAKGELIPSDDHVDADDLAKHLTGKDFNEVRRFAQVRADRTIMDRTFGSFGKTIEKVLGFQLPAATAATFSNTMQGLRKEITTGKLGEAIKQVSPAAAWKIDDTMKTVAVEAFKWAEQWRNQQIATIPTPAGPLVIENDPTLVQSLSQIKKPLDAVDFVFSSVGQGAAQILPSIATRGGTSFIQEIGHNYLDGVIAKAEKTGKTPEELIRSGEDEDDIARVFGLVQGGLESLGAGRVLKTIGYNAFKQDLKQKGIKWIKAAGEAAGTEFATETLQAIGNQLSTAKMTGLGTTDAVKQINWLQALDEGVAGAVGGAGVSAGGNITSSLASRVGMVAEIASKPNPTKAEVQTLDTILTEVAKAGKRMGDPREIDEIKEFIKKDVLTQIKPDEKVNTENAAAETATAPAADAGDAGVVPGFDDGNGQAAPSRGTAVAPDVTGNAPADESSAEGVRPEPTRDPNYVPPATPEEARGAGYIEQDGTRYDRPDPIKKVAEGKDVDITFSKKVSQPGKWAVIEAADMQPSHRKGNRNLSHFIPEAQPKKRDTAFGKAAVKGARDIASNLRPDQITDAPNAYFGAPTINARGEVIQGNSRADALQQYYEQDPAGNKYRQYLVDNADKFGIDADQIEQTFDHPVLVRMAPVEDARAIELGQYDVKDLESGGSRRIEAAHTVGKLSDDDSKTLSSVITDSEGETLSEVIRDNTSRIVDFLYKKGLINETQIENILNPQTGQINARGVEDLTAVIRGLAFKGGDPDLQNIFEQLPDSIKKGIDKAIPAVLRTGKMTTDLQRAIVGYNEYQASGSTNVNDWTRQSDMFKGGAAPMTRYNADQLRLIKLFDGKSQKDITTKLRQINQLMEGREGDMFTAPTPGVSIAQATEQVLGKEEPQAAPPKPPVITKAAPTQTVKKKRVEKKEEAGPKDDIDDLFDELDSILDQGQKMAAAPGRTVIPQQVREMGTKIVDRYMDKGVITFGEIARDVYERYGEEKFYDFFDALKAGYGSTLATADDITGMTPIDQVRAISSDQLVQIFKGHAPSTTTDLESDSPRDEADKPVVSPDVPKERTGVRAGTPAGGTATDDAGSAERGDSGFSDRMAPVGGKQSNTGIPESERAESILDRPGRGSHDSGGSEAGQSGIQFESEGGEQTDDLVDDVLQGGRDLNELIKQQEWADRNVEVIAGDKDNIRKSLPILLPHQVINVEKTEARFFTNPPKHGPNKGIMFTDQTGSGKTFTGLGIVKRMERMGKRNVLIIVPTDVMAKNWIDDAKKFGMGVSQLSGITDDGGANEKVTTTYANFRANEALMKRAMKNAFDLIIYDESHKLISNQQGEQTSADDVHKKISFSPDQAARMAREKFQSLIDKDYIQPGHLTDKTKEYIEKETARLTAQTKVLFLSATPFAYHKALSYADGYLFTMQEGEQEKEKAYRSFFIKNFGYRIRYNKLTEPEHGVDVSLMERMFNSQLKKIGAVSSTRLDLDFDYSREFVLVDDKIGQDIDEGYKMVMATKDDGKPVYPLLVEVAKKKFNWIYQNQLLEAIKAKNMVERVKAHRAMGRKVIIFHGYNENLPDHPFDFTNMEYWPQKGENAVTNNKVMRDISKFNTDHPRFKDLDLHDLTNPIQTFKNAFKENVVVFNGTIAKGKRKDLIRQFNTDDSGKDIIVIQQDAGKEGVSLHDVTGKMQRVGILLGMPYKPTDSIQMEGRGYRYGLKSDAILEYPVTHLNFEKIGFASKINVRVKTAENLAFGEDARNLEYTFKEGYKNPGSEDPSNNQGKGGREADGQYDTMDEFDKAITFYIARGKRTDKVKGREGVDYVATPEPLGLKMIEWLNLGPDEKFMEPSAGHGAIARFAPEYTGNKFIEPSYELRSDLAINAMGDIEPIRFEDFNIINKFHGIAMNPPFGSGGVTAMEHIEKALKHLNDGGRVIAIVPDGPAMNKRLDKFWQSGDSKGFYQVAEIALPSVTFKRAGTEVMTKILVIDKQVTKEGQAKMGRNQIYDWKAIYANQNPSINELFEHMRDMTIPARHKPSTGAVVAGEVKAVPGLQATIIEGKHTKYGYPVWTITLNKYLSTDVFARINQKAKEQHGYYSSFKGGGAVPGFIFKTAAEAEATKQFVDSNFQEDPDQTANIDAMNMAADPSKGRAPLSAFETRIHNTDGRPFKIYQKVIDLAHKYNPDSTLGQGYTSRGALGVFYMPSRNVRVNGLNSLSVASHELAHALDHTHGVISNMLKTTSPGDDVRKRLTELYVEYYPGAKPGDNPRKRAVEGYACLVQKYLEIPSEIVKKYKDLVDDFLFPGGKYFFNELGEYLQEVAGVIKEYQALDPLQKMGSRVVTEKIKADDDSWMTVEQRATQQIFDHIYPAELLAKRNGTWMTQDDISLWIRQSNNAYQMAEKNIAAKNGGFHGLNPDGSWSKKLNFNYRTIEQSLKRRKLYDDFGYYLFARRLKFEWEKFRDLESKLEEVEDPAFVQKLMLDMGLTDVQVAINIQQQMISSLQAQIAEIRKVLDNEQIDEQNANMAYNMAQPIFKEEEEMFDALTDQDLELAHNNLVQLLDDDGYQRMMATKGYSPFKRVWYDELVGQEEVPVIRGVGKTKISQFFKRQGSEKPVLNPFVGAMMNHAEVMRKSLRQMVYNKFIAVAEANPDLFQILALKTSPDASNRFPQDKDPNIIMARRNYKRVPILADQVIKKLLDENYSYHNVNLIEKVGIAMSQIFRTGTTGVFWQFFVNNIFLDQAAAAINTKNGMVPFISPIANVGKAATSIATEKLWGKATLFKDSMEAAYLKEYLFLAGQSHTFLSADAASTKELQDVILGQEKSWGQHVTNYIEMIARFMSAPGNASEILTRGTEYIMARKAGKPQVVALEMAGRVSAPFHHIGDLKFGTGRTAAPYIRTVPYFNSALQVFQQTRESLGTKEGRTRYAFAALSVMAASAASVWYILAKDDDDEQKKTLLSLPPEDLNKYLFLPNPYSSKLIKIRIPEQIGFIAGTQNMLMMEMAGQTNYAWTEYGKAASGFLPQQMNPFGGYQTLFSWAPQMIKPGMETAFGVKSYPNVRPIETERDRNLPPELRYNKFTSPGAVALGELAGWSPKKIDHFLEGTFGRSVKYLTGKGPYGMGDIFERELYFESSRQVQFFYDIKQSNSQKVKAWVDERKEYSDSEVEQMLLIDDLVLEIDANLKEWREIDEEDNAQMSVELRNQIFDQIRDLEKLVY